MVCEKCSYKDRKEYKKFGRNLCQLCNFFSPEEYSSFDSYLNEKIDWKVLETFRKYGQKIGSKQKAGMEKKAKQGKLMSRVARGYSLVEGRLVENEHASKIHSLFKEYLEKEISLNKLSKKFGLTVSGLKKVLKNRTYLGEIKFSQQIFRGPHNPLISSEIFYAVQRKLKNKGKKKKTEPDETAQ